MNRALIEKKLIGNGHLIAEAKRKRQSLTRAYRAIIGRVRQQAIDAGISRQAWQDLEMQGEIGIKGIVGSYVEAKFVGMQEMTKALKMRLYNIEGDHPQNGSTVGVMTLVHEWILPLDISPLQIAKEYLKEALFLAWAPIDDVWFKIKKFFPMLLVAFLMSGCHSRFNEAAPNQEQIKEDPTASTAKFFSVACCGDYVGPLGTFVYPSFLPPDHVSFCQRASWANHQNGPDEYIDGDIYLAMSVDCGHGHHDIGDNYYPPTGY